MHNAWHSAWYDDSMVLVYIFLGCVVVLLYCWCLNIIQCRYDDAVQCSAHSVYSLDLVVHKVTTPIIINRITKLMVHFIPSFTEKRLVNMSSCYS
mmetsp:Transcript_9495/g.10839  ORF Transcript_9495/g.10839 Transcript_9495/m.10839 type:complete len:95 (+) Transcript_9495:155-439(+)